MLNQPFLQAHYRRGTHRGLETASERLAGTSVVRIFMAEDPEKKQPQVFRLRCASLNMTVGFQGCSQ
jgi:hypothetical protein